MTIFKYCGIDISKWQLPSRMDWDVLHQHQDFVIIRACYGVKSDWAFEQHFHQARAHNMLVGAYIFFRQTQGWQEQFEAFKGELDRVCFGGGDILPIVDLEWNEKYDGEVDPAKFNTSAKSLIEEVRKIYGDCIVYISPGFYQTLGKPAWLLSYPWWIAHYDVPTPWCPWKDWVLWQYTSTGTASGCPGDVDLNWANDLPPVVRLAPNIEDHEIPCISEHDLYEDIETPIIPQVSLNPIEIPIRSPLATRSWWRDLLDWLKLRIFWR